MFGKINSVQITGLPCRRIVSAILVFSFLLISFSTSARAAGNKSNPVSKPAAKQTIASDVKLDSFQAERKANVTKISWKTSFELNSLGFRIWREDAGQKHLVNQEIVAGSLLKVSNGLLPAGSEYNFYDQTEAVNAYYWLEAVDVNAQSRWFGPAVSQISFAKSDSGDQSETIPELNNRAAGWRQQTDKIELTPARLSKFDRQKSSPVDNRLLTNDPNALKIEIRNRGMYRIDAQSLAENGFDRLQSENWKLFTGGIEQPMVVNEDGSLEFFGYGIDTIQTDANVYWLMTDETPGQRINRVAQNYLDSAQYSWTRVTTERKEKIYRVSSILNGARENWFGEVINSTATNQTLDLTDIATGSGQTATLAVDLQGITNIGHQVVVVLNGIMVGQINFNYYNRIEWTTTVPLGFLREGTNTLTFQALNGSSDVEVIESIRISYPRHLKAQNNRLEFGVAGGQDVKLKGFTSQRVRLFDVTNPTQVTEYAPESRLETDGTYSVTVASSANPRVMIAQGEGTQLFAATPLIRNYPSDLRNPQNQAKFIIIAPSYYGKSLWDFRDLRRLQGMPTELVAVEDIYDEFNNGVRSAEAIRAFLQYAKQNWAVKPDYAMLVGDATVDPRNYSGFGGNSSNQVPTMFTDTWNMETVSDEMMGDFDGDSLGEVTVGRLPAKDQDELESMLQRTINTEPMSREEINGRGVHFVSDANIGYNFAAGSRNAASTIPAGIEVNYLDRTTQDPGALRTDIINRINSGAAIVNYFGHASVGAWTSAQIFRNLDAPNLTNSKRVPLMVMLACLNGDFAETNVEGLGEAVMKQRFGGAFAVWAASGWNIAEDQEILAREFYRRVFTGMRLGDAARESKALFGLHDLRRTYVFFGDPTQRLVEP